MSREPAPRARMCRPTASLCRSGHRHQKKAQRRNGQPAPHGTIIARFPNCRPPADPVLTAGTRLPEPPSESAEKPLISRLSGCPLLCKGTSSCHQTRRNPRLRDSLAPRPLPANRPEKLFLLLAGDLRLALSRRLRGPGSLDWLLVDWLLVDRGLRRSRNFPCRSSLLFRRARDWSDCSRRNRRRFSLPLTRPAARCRRSNRRSRGLGSSPPLGWRRRWRWRRWGRQRLQIFQRLGPRAQLAIQQKQEDIVCDLRILRHLWRNVQFRHLRQRNLLLHLPPLGEEILDLLRHCLLPCGDCQKQNHL